MNQLEKGSKKEGKKPLISSVSNIALDFRLHRRLETVQTGLNRRKLDKIRLETKSGRVLSLTYGTKYDVT